MGKTKCIKDFPCEQCGIKGMLQLYLNNSLRITYARVRHYQGTINGKLQFKYCKQDSDYINRILLNLNIQPSKIESKTNNQLTKSIDQNIDNIDPNLNNLAYSSENKMGRSSSLVGHWLYEPKVAGSSPARPTIIRLGNRVVS